MRKMIVKRKCKNEDELRYWVKDTLRFASEEFGWDNFVFTGQVEEDGYYMIVVVEKEI